jgi:2-amino-4-hydroxy-6-hydroxymethyldihydropteridine diphosphokinase
MAEPRPDMRHNAIICIGSNAPDAMNRVENCIASLSAFLKVEASSSPYATTPAPPAPADGPDYANATISITTDLSIHNLTALLKETEKELGRIRGAESAGQVAIDIDVVIYDGTVCRHSEFAADYFQKGYQKIK